MVQLPAAAIWEHCEATMTLKLSEPMTKNQLAIIRSLRTVNYPRLMGKRTTTGITGGRNHVIRSNHAKIENKRCHLYLMSMSNEVES